MVILFVGLIFFGDGFTLKILGIKILGFYGSFEPVYGAQRDIGVKMMLKGIPFLLVGGAGLWSAIKLGFGFRAYSDEEKIRIARRNKRRFWPGISTLTGFVLAVNGFISFLPRAEAFGRDYAPFLGKIFLLTGFLFLGIGFWKWFAAKY